MSEIATAIGDLKLKNVEVWPTVQIVSRLHCTYAEFAPALVLQFKKVFETTFNEVCPDRKERISRRRSTLRLLYEPETAACITANTHIRLCSLSRLSLFFTEFAPDMTWLLWVLCRTTVFFSPPFATR